MVSYKKKKYYVLCQFLWTDPDHSDLTEQQRNGLKYESQKPSKLTGSLFKGAWL